MQSGASGGRRRPWRGRPPRSLNVVRDPRPEEVSAPIDWSGWYLSDEEDMGQGAEQERAITTLKSVLHELRRERAWPVCHIGADAFFAWVPGEPLVRVSPDVYILDDPPAPPLPKSFQTWLPGHKPPRFAVEIVSSDTWRKDYDEAPAKYAQLGTRELAIFDADAASGTSAGGRVPLQVYQREDDGSFVRVYAGKGPASSRELAAWLVVTREGPCPRLRVARDEAGKDLVPTTDEAREKAERERANERQAREKAEQDQANERQAREKAEQDQANERQAREKAEQERDEAGRRIAELTARLARLEK